MDNAPIYEMRRKVAESRGQKQTGPAPFPGTRAG